MYLRVIFKDDTNTLVYLPHHRCDIVVDEVYL